MKFLKSLGFSPVLLILISTLTHSKLQSQTSASSNPYGITSDLYVDETTARHDVHKKLMIPDVTKPWSADKVSTWP